MEMPQRPKKLFGGVFPATAVWYMPLIMQPVHAVDKMSD